MFGISKIMKQKDFGTIFLTNRQLVIFIKGFLGQLPKEIFCPICKDMKTAIKHLEIHCLRNIFLIK